MCENGSNKERLKELDRRFQDLLEDFQFNVSIQTMLAKSKNIGEELVLKSLNDVLPVALENTTINLDNKEHIYMFCDIVIAKIKKYYGRE